MNDIDKFEFSERLNKKWEEVFPGKTYKWLGKQTDCSESMVKKWMRGENIPQLKTLLKLSELLNCSINYLLTGKKDPMGTEYILQQTGLSRQSIRILASKKFNIKNKETYDELLTQREYLISEIHRILYSSPDYQSFRESEDPSQVALFAEEKKVDLWASLRMGLNDQELRNEISQIYAPAFEKLRPALFRDIKAVYLKYCDVEKQLQKLKDEIRFQDPFLDTVNRIINSEQLIEDISKYLNKPILRTFRIDDGDPSGERMNFDNENIHGRYDSGSGATWLEILDGQSHTVRINKDFVIDADFIRKMFIDRIRDDLDAMID